MYCTLYLNHTTNHQSDRHILLAKIPSLPLGYHILSEQHTVQCTVHYTVDCTIQKYLHCIVNITVHCNAIPIVLRHCQSGWSFLFGYLSSPPTLQCIARFAVVSKVMYTDFYNILYTVLYASWILYYTIDYTQTSKFLDVCVITSPIC